MRKEIAPELYNYNKFPGPEFRRVEDKVLSEELEFVLVENVKDAFETKAFCQRFSEILTKFDYIVGDWSNEQLRLRGFYKDSQGTLENMKISHLEDYLIEYCSFGCAYFILENQKPKRASFDKKSHHHKERDHKEREKSRRRKREHAFHMRDSKQDSTIFEKSASKSSFKKRKPQQRNEKERHFVIRQK
ncbi:Hypothetical DUF1027 domain protein [Streptococcus sp. DD10]|uniref:YutD family protein n=1 Tax=Streptococcus sp. DD10 TaxID=1777878 RepID=UPI00079678E4|nr:YutD-like domain-containing protein [Streptococcus sp. DD10]KXT74185.1 Hypothetical DUF1027 domain protein [Streptococcus sp. DD10]